MLNNSNNQPYFSAGLPGAVSNRQNREKKAKTMIAVLSDFLGSNFQSLSVLDIGTSTGIIANYLSNYFGKVIGIDIDEPAIEYARDNFIEENLAFEIGDSMDLNFSHNVFDVVICAHVYEHVLDADRLMKEIYRVLKPGGVCYFAAGNRLSIQEPHHHLPFLSIIPRPLAHVYLNMAGKGDFYHEKHLTYWGLKRLVHDFERIDYTEKIITNAQFYQTGYMIRPGTNKAILAKLIVRYAYWLCPGYIWLLQKIDG